MTNVTSASCNLDPMSGYSLWTTEAGYGLTEFEGTPNSGNQSFSLIYGGGTPTGDYGWNLVGNPYTTTINWNEVSIPANMDAAIYRFDLP